MSLQLIPVKLDDSIDETAVLWRYMDFNKCNTLLRDNDVYFARLDKFNDPLEGLTYEQRELLQEKRNRKHGIYFPSRKKLLDQLKLSRKSILARQHGCYSSCWYLSKYKSDESSAMWSLYANRESFAVAIPFRILKKLIADSLLNLADPELNEALYGMVEYLGSYDYGMKKHQEKLVASPFIKSPHFAYENELRFMLFRSRRNYHIHREGIKLPLKSPIRDFHTDISIFAHPNMSFSKFKTFRKNFRLLGFDLSPSRIITEYNVKKFIED